MNAEPRPKKFTPALIPTKAQFAEWQYRKIERLGLLCESRIPTVEEEAMARKDANDWLEKQPLASCMDTFDDPTIEPVI